MPGADSAERYGAAVGDSEERGAAPGEPMTFQEWAGAAGLSNFKVIGQGSLPPKDPRVASGIWLIFSKGNGE
mgnify:FL=1